MLFTDFFAHIFEELSLWFLLFLLISFLIGLLTALWMRASVVRRLRREKTRLEGENTRMAREHREAVDRDTLSQAELVHLRAESDNFRRERRGQEEQRAAFEEQIEGLRRQLAAAQTDRREAQEQLAALKATYEGTLGQLEFLQAQALALPSEERPLDGSAEALPSAIVEDAQETVWLREALEAAQNEKAAVEAQLMALQDERDHLAAELDALHKTPALVLPEMPAVVGGLETVVLPPMDTIAVGLPNVPESFKGLADEIEVDFVKHPILGTDVFDEVLLKARRAIEHADFFCDVDVDVLEEDPERLNQALEADVNGPELGSRSAAPRAVAVPLDLSAEERAELDSAIEMAVRSVGTLELEMPSMPQDFRPEPEPQPELPENQEVEVPEAEAVKAFRKRMAQLPATDITGRRDDLKEIIGVGPSIEAKLHHLGLHSFAQLASLDEDAVNLLTEAIEFFPGRIQRDNWVGQAQKLLQGRGTES